MKYELKFMLELFEDWHKVLFETAVNDKIENIELSFIQCSENGFEYKAETDDIRDFLNLGQTIAIMYMIADTDSPKVCVPIDFVSPTISYKEKYEKCINVIERFDAGIIGLYDL